MANPSNTWRPGCGRPHPAYDVILEWALGRIPKVAIQRLGKHVPTPQRWIEQEFPSWDPGRFTFKVPELHYKFFRAYLTSGEPGPRLASATSLHDQERVEADLVRKYGKIEWLHPWSTNGNREGRMLPMFANPEGGSAEVYVLHDRRKKPFVAGA